MQYALGGALDDQRTWLLSAKKSGLAGACTRGIPHNQYTEHIQGLPHVVGHPRLARPITPYTPSALDISNLRNLTSSLICISLNIL